MNKENILFGIVGLLLGLIVGFMFANNVNQKSAVAPVPLTAAKQNSNMPEGHPDISGATNPSSQLIVSPVEVQAATDRAVQEPENFEAQMKAAEVSYQNGSFDKAVEYLKQANKLKPDDYETIVNLGNASFDGGNYAEAEKWYSAALVKKTEDPDVRTDLGLTFIFRDPPNYDRAIKEFEDVLAKDINHPQALQNLTVAYTKKGNAAKAKETVDKLEKVDPTNASVAKLREDIQKIQTK
ncbi:MAG TPA: tetratricopeptide repeat protein [Pyrinomonadaceae bacterium]|nr:tetratricopeptide repeat protein [Pyrinomonadaceae bacterium]